MTQTVSGVCSNWGLVSKLISMANQDHLRHLERGTEAWNSWRGDYPDIHPELSKAYIPRVNLPAINFEAADLAEANLRGANLWNVNLTEANLEGANLEAANLPQAILRNVDLTNTDLRGANLTEAQIEDIILNGATYDDSTRWPADFDPAVTDYFSSVYCL
jgi:uncharacterized protein YjbI with pentapeptide repeats